MKRNNNDILIYYTVVQASPPLPPSLAQANQRSLTSANDPKNFVKSLWRLMGNYGFILLLLSYGINVGSFYAISTLLNPIILSYFPVSISYTWYTFYVANCINFLSVSKSNFAGFFSIFIAGIPGGRRKDWPFDRCCRYVRIGSVWFRFRQNAPIQVSAPCDTSLTNLGPKKT